MLSFLLTICDLRIFVYCCVFIIPHGCFIVNNFENWVLIEHEYMGSNWTHAEGYVTGTAAKMFIISGPVIVYGLTASVVNGLVYWILQII